MVVQLRVDESDSSICKKGRELAVYEFTETFGGYWGPIPEEVFEQNLDKPVFTQQYTLQTRPRVHTTTATTTEEVRESPTTTKITSSTATTQSFINIEVPLVNFSVNMAPGDNADSDTFDIHGLFDQMYDVIPRPEQAYDTNVVPLVNIAVKDQGGLRGGSSDQPRYEIDYDLGAFTLDQRLTITERPKKTTTNRNRNRWKKKKLQNKRVHGHSKINNSHGGTSIQPYQFFRKAYTLPTTSHRTTHKPVRPQASTGKKQETTTDVVDFHVIDEIIKTLNESGNLKMQEESTHSDVLSMLDMSGDAYHNMSVYLAPYPTYTFLSVSAVPTNFPKIQSEIPSDGRSESILSLSLQNERVVTLEYNANKHHLEEPAKTTDDLVMEITNSDITAKKIETTPSVSYSELTVSTSLEVINKAYTHIYDITNSTGIIHQEISNLKVPATTTIDRSLAGTLVDHESWENVVQAAPVMAGLLNQHEPELENSSYFHITHPARVRRGVHRKRNIEAIDIENAKPRRRPTSKKTSVSSGFYRPLDAKEFARLLEVPDDEMSNHVKIKVDPNSHMLYNLCETYEQLSSQYMVLLNSSRVILSIDNFRMSHVMVVLTMAKSISEDEQCPEQTVECQVLGTRICIDRSNACDSIPNCGSLNAYDEDRILCGAMGHKPNVCLVAITFLTVVATVLAIVHYWLRNCVPNVANAFFVYWDTDENELFLKPIMRPPGDAKRSHSLVSDTGRMESKDVYFEGRRYTTQVMRGMCSILSKVNIFKRRKLSHEMPEGLGGRTLSDELQRYSFPELEIRNLMKVATVDQQVQTGESLEMEYLKQINSLSKNTNETKLTRKRQRSIHILPRQQEQKTESLENSLDAPGFSKGTPGSNRKRAAVPEIVEEKEILSTIYEPHCSKILKPEVCSVQSLHKTNEGHGTKSLRFNEHAMYISRDDEEGGEIVMETPSPSRRKHSMSGFPVRKHRRQHQKSDDNSASRSEFRIFFKKKKDHK